MRGALLLGVAIALLSGARSAHAQDRSFSVGEFEPIAFVLNNPTGDTAKVSASEIIREVSDLFRAHTNLRIELQAPDVVKTCEGRLHCLVTAARQDYKRSALLDAEGNPRPYHEHRDALGREGVAYSRFLFVLSVLSIPGEPDELSIEVVDTDEALRLFHHWKRGAPDWRDAVEARVNAAALVVPTFERSVTNSKEVRRFLDEVITRRFRSVLERTRNWEPFGRIMITGAPPDMTVSLDGNNVGATADGVTNLTDVRPGRYLVGLTDAQHYPFETQITVERGGESQVVPALRARPTSKSVLRPVTRWSGVVIATAGAVLIGTAIATADSGLVVGCFDEEDCAPGTYFTSFGYDPDRAEDAPREINPSGVLVAPLGYSLLGMGATWAIGSFLEDFPAWLTAVAGLGLGVASYSISALVASP